MPVNFTNPEEVKRFKEFSLGKGVNPVEVDNYIERRIKGTTSTSKLLESGTGDELSGEKGMLFKLAKDAASQALTSIESGQVKTGPVTTRGQQFLEKLPGQSEKPGTTFRAQLALARTTLRSALLGGQIGPQEGQSLLDALPQATDQEPVVKQKLANFISLVNSRMGVSELPSQPADISQEEALPSTPSDLDTPPDSGLLVSEDSKYKISGTPQELLASTGDIEGYGNFADKKVDGGTVTGRLLNYLAQSNALPFLGSVVGGIAGAGLGSIATGAVGAVTGRAAQQALRELIAPKEQDLSDAAKVMLTEGLTDALMGAVGMGVVGVASKGARGVKLLLTRGGKETTEAALKVAQKEATEAGLKTVPKKLTRIQQLKKKGFGVKPGEIEDFRDAFKVNLMDEIDKLQYSDDLSKNAVSFGKKAKEAGKKLDKALKGKTVDANKILDILNDVKKASKRGGVVKRSLSAFNKAIDNHIDQVVGLVEQAGGKGKIPAKELNEIIKEFDPFFTGADPLQGTAKKALQSTRGQLNALLKKTAPDMAPAKQEWFLNNFLAEKSLGQIDKATAKPLIKWYEATPFLFGGQVGRIGANAVLTKRAMEAWTNNPLFAAKALEFMIKTGQKSGSKEVTRSVVREALKQGVKFDVAPNLIRQTIEAGASRAVQGNELPPEPPTLQPGGGGLPDIGYETWRYK